MKVHTVEQGDSLWKISKMSGVSLEALIAANPQIPNPDKIDVGLQVNIPDGSSMAAPAPSPMPLPEPVPAPAPAPENNTPAPADMEPMSGMPAPEANAIPQPAPAPAYPSVPKWEGLWKYVVKNGDSLFKIAKQVGVTLEHLKAANPQVPDPEKIYPGQVLNIPSSGMKSKSGNPGMSLKEKLTSPMTQTLPLPKEQLTTPKEMAPVEKPISIMSPAAPTPMAPMPMPMHVAPAPAPHFDINANLQYAPHKHHSFNFSPQKETNANVNTNIGNFPHTENVLGAQQAQQSAPSVGNTAVSPMAMAPHPHMMAHMMPMYYIPVTVKKQKKHKKCHKKHKKCGCHKKHGHGGHGYVHGAHMGMHIGMYPKTFYREED